MHEIKESVEKRATEVFAAFPYDRLFLRDALTRATGNLFADSSAKPETHFLRNALRQVSFISGQYDGEFVAEIAFLLQAEEWGPSVSLPSATWRDDLIKRDDLFYIGEPMITFSRLGPPSEVEMSGDKVVRLDEAHIDQIKPNGWTSAAEFVQKNVGFGVVSDGEVLSYAISNFAVSDVVEVAVWTSSDHQRMGLAFESASALLNFCRTERIDAQWTSWSGNTAACNLARKLGFEEEHLHDWAFVKPKA